MECAPIDDIRPNPVISSSVIGILAKWWAIKEVTAVYPELSATSQPYRQEIRFFRGDSFDIPVQVQNDDELVPEKVSIDRSVIKFAAKLGVGNYPGRPLRSIGNEGATILKRSYNPAEIEITNSTNGQAIIHIKKSDTFNHPLGDSYLWDLEITKPVTHITDHPGTIRVQQGDYILMGNGTDFPDSIGLGDIIHIQGLHVMILERLDRRTLRADFNGWTTERNLEYNLYIGQSKTVAAGPWLCIGDVVI